MTGAKRTLKITAAYDRVAKATSAELLDELTQSAHRGIRIIIKAELMMRLYPQPKGT